MGPKTRKQIMMKKEKEEELRILKAEINGDRSADLYRKKGKAIV